MRRPTYFVYWPDGMSPAAVTCDKAKMEASVGTGLFVATKNARYALRFAVEDQPTAEQIEEFHRLQRESAEKKAARKLERKASSVRASRKRRQRDRERDRERGEWSKGADAWRNQGHR